MIHRAFLLNDRTAADLMTPLDEIVSLRVDNTVEEAAQRIVREPYSRYPVFGKHPHDVRGMVLSRDILEAVRDGQLDTRVEEVMQQILTVPADQRSDALLYLFRDKHLHLAIVRQAGQTIGLVTLEDVIEALVGDIQDERDVVVEH